MNTELVAVKSLIERVRAAIFDTVLFGSVEHLEMLLVAFLARGHVLVEGPPGTGKTLSAKLLAHLLSRSFRRIQFTSDMLPSDILGAHVFSPGEQKFTFIPGPIFSDFILADEINRTSPRTQSALLEAMEERQVTTEGETRALKDDFFVIATQNPFEMEGTFPLPEAQVDRFLIKLTIGHNSPEIEKRLLAAVLRGDLPPKFGEIEPVSFDRAAIESEINSVHVDESILHYITQIIDATRHHSMIRYGSSVRGGIALTRAARVLAALHGEKFVTVNDVKQLVIPVLRHRIGLSPEAFVSRISEAQLLEEIVAKVEFPK